MSLSSNMLSPPASSPVVQTAEPSQRPPALPPQEAPPLLSPRGTLFSDIVTAIQVDHQVPGLLCAQAALGVGALVLQDKVVVERPNDGEAIPVSLLVIGVAESGGRKSRIFKELVGPVMAYLQGQKTKTGWAAQDYANRMEIWEKTRKQLVNILAKAEAAALTEQGE